MKIVMSLGLQAILLFVVVTSATRVTVPPLRDRTLSAAHEGPCASVATPACRRPGAGLGGPPPRAGQLAAVPPLGRAARAGAWAIPADRPRPPLGRFKLTAYSGPQLGQAEPITATGTIARAGRTVAVDPTVIPLGSRIFIEGIGERIAEDVGGAVKGLHIDVYLPSVAQAWRFGVQRARVSVVPAAAGRPS